MTVDFDQRIAEAIDRIAAEAQPSPNAQAEITRRIVAVAARRQRSARLLAAAAVIAVVLALIGTATVGGRDAQVASGIERLEFDFEHGQGDSREPAGWTAEGLDFGYQVRAVDDRAASGRWSARIALVRERTEDFAGSIEQCVPGADFAGKRIRLSGFVASEAATGGGAALWLQLADGADTPLHVEVAREQALIGTHDFTYLQIVADADQGTEEVCFGGRLEGGGVAWFDDIVVETVGPSGEGPALTRPAPREFHNLDFTDGRQPSGVPSRWVWLGQPEYDVSLVPGRTDGDRGAGRLEWKRETLANLTGQLIQCVDGGAWVAPGRIEAKAWTRALGVEAGSASLEVTAISRNGNELPLIEQAPSRGLAGTTPWQEHTVTISVPDDTARVCIGLRLTGQGAAEIDDVRLRRA